MSESTSTTVEDGTEHQRNGGRPAAAETSGAILFPELVWAHFEWQHESGQLPAGLRVSDTIDDTHDGDREHHNPNKVDHEKTYRTKLRAFQGAEGEILDAYWCWSDASAVALTAKQPKRSVRRGRGSPELRLHRVTDWATIKAPEVAELLHHYDALAIKVNQVLNPVPKRIAMERIFAEQSYLLGFVETTPRERGDAELTGLIGRQRAALKQVEDYYDRAGNNAARIYYFIGMLLGMLVLALAAALVAIPLILWAGIDPIDMRDYLAAYAAGAVGACVSVMSRMKQGDGFKVDYEVGRIPLYVLGAVRPAIGAIFGSATYFALQSSLVQMSPEAPEKAFYFFALLAFLSGFSERFALVLFGKAEKTVTTTLNEDEAREKADGIQAGDGARR